jgi:hypothetical protein
MLCCHTAPVFCTAGDIADVIPTAPQGVYGVRRVTTILSLLIGPIRRGLDLISRMGTPDTGNNQESESHTQEKTHWLSSQPGILMT